MTIGGTAFQKSFPFRVSIYFYLLEAIPIDEYELGLITSDTDISLCLVIIESIT